MQRVVLTLFCPALSIWAMKTICRNSEEWYWEYKDSGSNLQKFFISDGCLSIAIIYLLIIKIMHTYLTSYYASMVLAFKLYGPKFSFCSVIEHWIQWCSWCFILCLWTLPGGSFFYFISVICSVLTRYGMIICLKWRLGQTIVVKC